MKTLIPFLFLGLTTPVFANPPRPPVAAQSDAPDAAQLQRAEDYQDELLARIEQHDPRIHRELVALRDADYDAFLRRLLMVFKQIRTQKQKVEAQFRPQIEDIRRRAQQDMTAAERKALKADALAVSEALFDARQADRRARITELRDALERLEGEVEERNKERKDLVKAFADQLLLEKVDL